MSTPSPAGLRVFRDPASVAVVGASNNRSKWGYWLAAGALAGAGRRRVDLVNRRAGLVCGHQTATSLTALDEVPELVALCVPAAQVPAVVDEGSALGVRGFLGITAGVADEAALAARIRAGGARLVGTNSLGIVDTATDLRLAWGEFEPGPLAVVSQSGQLGSELAVLGARHGLGISRFVSVGNASDVTAKELLADLADHDATRVVALYLENFADGAALFDTLREVGKPTLLLTVGASAASSRLARSHTGSLTSSLDVVDAACRATGVARVGTPGELIDVARALLATRPPRGRRVAIVGDSGGQCGIAADTAHALGLAVPPLSEKVIDKLAAMLPPGAAVTNPVDLAGAGEHDLTSYATTVETALSEVDAAVLTGYFGRYVVDVPALAEQEARVACQLGAVARDKPVLVHTMAPEDATARALWSVGVPAFGHIEQALSALRGLVAVGSVVERAPMPDGVRPIEVVPDGYWATRELLAGYGIRFPRGTVREPERLSAPFVAKAGWLAHKSEVGGVRIGLSTVDELRAALDAMLAKLGPGEYVIEEQDVRPDTVEVLIGARRDPDFGPLIVVGAGGTETELHRDLAMELAPVTVHTAHAMLERLRCAPLLHGWRGRPTVDIDALAELVHTISVLVAASPAIGELELNPVRVGPDGPIAVDALIVGADKESA
ncbi:MAG TPA: acetate--CoA ligase family protein [Pseudonocardiaceae bacterium]|jgi:acyl-CoA synthetase (NDP forming)|nr:acetate--CoA ligase family protein [Pseudonocardiaceae bacterium]